MKGKKLEVYVGSDGSIYTINGWFIGRLVDMADYGQLGNKELAEVVNLGKIQEALINGTTTS